jgi:predicted dehydrogenase
VLWALGDVFPDRIETSLNNLTAHAPERVQVPPQRRFSGFDGYRGVLESGVDMVILTTPPHFRPVQLRAALEAGKHVFCEKPVAVDATGVRSVLESAAMADARRLNLMSGFCWRYSYPERATYKRLHEGAIGDIVAMHTTYHTGTLRQNSRRPEWSDMEWQLRNWFHFTWLSGDHIVEQACHAIDKINWAMQGRMPLRATALGGRQARRGAESGNVYDHFAVIYEYDGGVRCHHTCRQIDGCSNDNSDYIQGTRGRCFVNGWTPRHVIEGESPWSYEGPRRDMYQVEHDELFASIRGKAPRVNDGVSMAHSTLMAIMGRTAAYTGQTVTWEQALSASEDLTPAAYEFGPLPVAPVPIPGA